MSTAWLPALLVAGLAALLAKISVHDLRCRQVLNTDNLAIAIAGAVYVAVMGLNGWHSLAGFLLGGLFLAALAELYRFRKGQSGLGYGDVKLAAAGGIWVGWQGVMPMFLSASLLAMAALIFQPVRARLLGGETSLPFAPFLSAGLLFILSLQQGWVPLPDVLVLAVKR